MSFIHQILTACVGLVSPDNQDLTCLFMEPGTKLQQGIKVCVHETRKKRSMLYSSILHSRNWNYTRSKTYSIHSSKHGNGLLKTMCFLLLKTYSIAILVYQWVLQPSTIHVCWNIYLPLLWHRHLFKCWHCWPNKIGRLLCSKAMPKRK